MLEKTLYIILKIIFFIVLMICVLMIELFVYCNSYYGNSNNINKSKNEVIIEKVNQEAKTEIKEVENQNMEENEDWRLILVNAENTLPEDYEVKLANFDATRQFDERAIGELIRNVTRYESRRCFKYMDTICL